MKSFQLEKPYENMDQMRKSEEMEKIVEQLKSENIDLYEVKSRIGNKYDIFGNPINGFAKNPYYKVDCYTANVTRTVVTQSEVKDETPAEAPKNKKENKKENKEMPREDLHKIIDEEIENEISEKLGQLKALYEEKIANLEEQHAAELAEARNKVKAELLELLK